MIDTVTVAASGIVSTAVAVGLTWAMMKLTLTRIASRVRQQRIQDRRSRDLSR